MTEKSGAVCGPPERVDGGDLVTSYYRSIRSIPLLTREEELELGKRSRLGDITAREKLVEGNLRLVATFALKYRGRGMELLDLIQEGNIGLMKAAEKYDERKGWKFSTYAVWWIKQHLTRGIENQRHLIRLPIHVQNALKRVAEGKRELAEKNRECTPEALATLLNLPLEKVRELLELAPDPVSLEEQIGEDENANRLAFLEDSLPSPEEALSEKERVERTDKALTTLSSREASVLRLRFGLGGEQEHTLEEIRQKMDLSRERIRQIEFEALEKLRHPPKPAPPSRKSRRK